MKYIVILFTLAVTAPVYAEEEDIVFDIPGPYESSGLIAPPPAQFTEPLPVFLPDDEEEDEDQ